MLSIPHLIVIFIVALVIFGPEKIPELARNLGKVMAEFRRAKDCVVLLTGNDVPTQVEALGRHLPVDWLHAPFSRCLVCNGVLQAADPARLAEVPEFSRESLDALYACSECHRLYWHGSHVRRMRAKLHHWKHRG